MRSVINTIWLVTLITMLVTLQSSFLTLLTYYRNRENVMITLLGLVKTPRPRDEALIEALRKTLRVLDHVKGLLLHVTRCY